MPGQRPHIWSLIVLTSTFLVSFLMLWKYNKKSKTIPLIWISIIAVTISSLGVHGYELIHACFWWNSQSQYAVPLVMLISPCVTVSLLLFEDKYFKFLHFNKATILLLSIVFITFIFLWYNNFFSELTNFINKVGPDPHNEIWMLGKAAGLFMFIPLIKTGVKSNETQKTQIPFPTC